LLAGRSTALLCRVETPSRSRTLFQYRVRELPGANNRSKQDDAFLISDLVATLYEKEGPSTIVLVAGDADYGPPLKKAIEKGWRVEVAFIARGVSTALTPFVHEFRTINPVDVQHLGHGYRG
jgi:uncharacterized LabA/DUF88 family protein